MNFYKTMGKKHFPKNTEKTLPIRELIANLRDFCQI